MTCGPPNSAIPDDLGWPSRSSIFCLFKCNVFYYCAATDCHCCTCDDNFAQYQSINSHHNKISNDSASRGPSATAEPLDIPVKNALHNKSSLISPCLANSFSSRNSQLISFWS